MTDDMSGLVRLTRAGVKPAAVVLGQAFATEPLATHFFPEKKRGSAAETFSALELYLGVRYGEVYATSSNLEGIAAWLPPGKAPFNGWQTLRAVPLRILLRFARQGAASLRPMGEYIDNLHRELVPFPHWYLQIIGVAPQHQGKGYSSLLLRPMLARLDREGLPCYLETQTEKNVAIYQRFGFRVIHNGVLPGTELPVVAMLRENG